MWRFIQQHNRHFRMTDLVGATILCTFMGMTLAILIAARLRRGEAWDWDLFLMAALCITGVCALFVYARLALERVGEKPGIEERRHQRMARGLMRKTVAFTNWLA